ncbi:hypothetical protein HBB16_11540 [Pseudonocardia sp. MCCB 268]|nr:hypothetical protein [Pseudonocardia cytotoxica]
MTDEAVHRLALRPPVSLQPAACWTGPSSTEVWSPTPAIIVVGGEMFTLRGLVPRPSGDAHRTDRRAATLPGGRPQFWRRCRRRRVVPGPNSRPRGCRGSRRRSRSWRAGHRPGSHRDDEGRAPVPRAVPDYRSYGWWASQ